MTEEQWKELNDRILANRGRLHKLYNERHHLPEFVGNPNHRNFHPEWKRVTDEIEKLHRVNLKLNEQWRIHMPGRAERYQKAEEDYESATGLDEKLDALDRMEMNDYRIRTKEDYNRVYNFKWWLIQRHHSSR